ncbi:hypothetical protein GY12_17460 [Micrococcus luteus]|nr:hypothetical protein GY12_17460 [Micrococcus luteus]
MVSLTTSAPAARAASATAGWNVSAERISRRDASDDPAPSPLRRAAIRGDHPRRLLGRVECRPGCERHAADVDPLGSGVRRSVGLGEGVLQDAPAPSS